MAIAEKLVLEKMDRELFSELVEPPIHAHLLRVQAPLMNALDPHFHIKLNGKFVWHWGSITESKLFEALQANLRKHGYSLTTKCAQRIEKVLKQHIRGMVGWQAYTVSLTVY